MPDRPNRLALWNKIRGVFRPDRSSHPDTQPELSEDLTHRGKREGEQAPISHPEADSADLTFFARKTRPRRSSDGELQPQKVGSTYSPAGDTSHARTEDITEINDRDYRSFFLPCPPLDEKRASQAEASDSSEFEDNKAAQSR